MKRIDTAFYKRAFLTALPIMIQQGITNFVSMLDNVMVGRIGTDQMSGVAIVNQLLFVIYLCVFGGLAGIGIFTSQFQGKGDEEGVKYTFRASVYTALIITTAGFIILLVLRDPLISIYLHEDSGIGNAAATFRYANEYLMIIFFEFIPFALSQAYSSVLKSTGETVAPMKASLVAVAVNLIGNYILIYGKFGAPEMGVAGAALATLASRFVEFAIIAVHAHRRTDKYTFMRGVYKSFYVPAGLIKNCIVKGIPLVINEGMWAGGLAALMRNYSERGLSVVAAFNISQIITNIFGVVFVSMGIAIGILIGMELGKGKMDTVGRDAVRLVWFSVILSIGTAVILFLISAVFPKVYNTSDDIRLLASRLIRVAAICMPIQSYINAVYFIIRSGGKTLLTLFFDSVFIWVVMVPVSFLLVRFTGLNIITIYFIVCFIEIIKCFAGAYLLHKGIWINDITEY